MLLHYIIHYCYSRVKGTPGWCIDTEGLLCHCELSVQTVISGFFFLSSYLTNPELLSYVNFFIWIHNIRTKAETLWL